MSKTLTTFAFTILLLSAIPLGVAAALAAFFLTAYATSSVALLTLSGALALVMMAGSVSAWAVRGLVRRQRPVWRWMPLVVTGGTFLVVGLSSSVLVFSPMEVTNTPLEPTEYTRYWELPTGSRLAYMHLPAEGTRRDTVVIALHGGPGAPNHLLPREVDLRLAAAGFDVYHYHQVGAGLSNRLENIAEYTVGRHLADLDAIRQEIGAERLILIGGSWGGTLAAHYLATHPERVERAVFGSPGAIWSPAFDEQVSDGPETDIISGAATLRFVMVYALQQINPGAAHNLASDSEMSGFFQPLIGRVIAQDVAECDARDDLIASDDEPVIPQGFGYYANMMTTVSMTRTDDPRPSLKHLETPVLVLRGACDRLRPKVHDEYLELLSNGTLRVLDDVGHSVSTSPHYADVVQAFVLGQPLPETSQTTR